MDKAREIAHHLLEIGAVRFNFKEPFVWASGWKSPVYCDNRVSLSNPRFRSLVRDAYVDTIKKNYPEVQVIAGVATGAIAQGALTADRLELPFAYVREKAKDHGLMKLIEGAETKGANVVVVEDLISTGGSSLKACETLRSAGANVLGMVAAFTYEFGTAADNFKKANCRLVTLSDFTNLWQQALKEGTIADRDVAELHKWHDHPAAYFV